MARHVVIIGGGSGGTILANSLDAREFAVTVVSDAAQHLFQPALLYVAFKNDRAHFVRDERTLLSRHVHLVQDTVTQVDLGERVVVTSSGPHLVYDDLVIATGITTNPSEIPGLSELDAEFGNYHSTLDAARRLWSKVDAFQGGTIVLGQSSPICKCPPSPVEGILLVDELLRRRKLRNQAQLVFFTPYPRAYPAEPMNQVIEPILRERGIEIRTFFDVDRIDPSTRTIFSIEGEQISYDLPIVIPPFVGAAISYTPDVLDPSRFVMTEKRSLRVQGVEHAYAIGDGANLPTSKSGVGAHLQAKVVAKQLRGLPASFNGRTHCPVDLADGRGSFVIGSFDAPVVKLAPSRLRHLMKAMFSRIYWLSLRGVLEPAFDAYFKMTEPKARAKTPSTPEPAAKT